MVGVDLVFVIGSKGVTVFDKGIGLEVDKVDSDAADFSFSLL